MSVILMGVAGRLLQAVTNDFKETKQVFSREDVPKKDKAKIVAEVALPRMMRKTLDKYRTKPDPYPTIFSLFTPKDIKLLKR